MSFLAEKERFRTQACAEMYREFVSYIFAHALATPPRRLLRSSALYTFLSKKDRHHTRRYLSFLGNNPNFDTKSIEIKRAIPLQMYAIEYADPQFFLV